MQEGPAGLAQQRQRGPTVAYSRGHDVEERRRLQYAQGGHLLEEDGEHGVVQLDLGVHHEAEEPRQEEGGAVDGNLMMGNIKMCDTLMCVVRSGDLSHQKRPRQ